MMNHIELKEINRLIKERFYIPTYQRGYRWDTEQVRDLLNDLYEFKNTANVHNGEFYCLQPIVVKKRPDGQYDVIDGQQRLTTILIIQKYLNKPTFHIEYATRPGSSEFLDTIKENADGDDSKYQSKNIDFFFMTNAFDTVRNWFEYMIENYEEYSLPDEFSTYLLKHCKVIWYEINDESNPENIFTRLNIGKIPLTDAELIKALFLRRSNFDGNEELMNLKQLEIANEWDYIENTLQDDRVWYFINPKTNKFKDTRIDYIFKAIADDRSGNVNQSTFSVFSEMLEDENIFEIWKDVKDYFKIIMEWYEDQVLFHLIGFLTSSTNRFSLKSLITDYFANEFKKDEFVNYVKQQIRLCFDGVDIDQLTYEVNSDRATMADILLLFNVVTVMNKGNAYSRFPFDSFNRKHWSLEHIHAQNTDGIGNSKELWLAWIDEHIASFRQFVDPQYKNIVELLEGVDRENITFDSFDELFNQILYDIQDDYGVDLHSIDNMALLDQSANSSISNYFFDVKRSMIVDMDRAGLFIPVCTRNVFLKYYSDDPTQIHYWSERDREDYLNVIKSTLSDYIGGMDNE